MYECNCLQFLYHNYDFCWLIVLEQSDNMTDKWHVYMTKDGRISLAGLNLAKCAYLADAIVDSYYNVH